MFKNLTILTPSTIPTWLLTWHPPTMVTGSQGMVLFSFCLGVCSQLLGPQHHCWHCPSGTSPQPVFPHSPKLLPDGTTWSLQVEPCLTTRSPCWWQKHFSCRSGHTISVFFDQLTVGDMWLLFTALVCCMTLFLGNRNKRLHTPDREPVRDQNKSGYNQSLMWVNQRVYWCDLQECVWGITYRSRNSSKAATSPKVNPSVGDSWWELETWNSVRDLKADQ